MSPAPLQLRTADIFLTASSTVLGRTIRFFESHPGDPAKVNHTGLIVAGDRDIVEVEYAPLGCYFAGLRPERTVVRHLRAESIEALVKVRRGDFRGFYGGEATDLVAIFRDKTLNERERGIIETKARSYEGRTYGFAKLLLHAGDWQLTLQAGHEVYFFRRLAKLDRYPICSWLVAESYAKVDRTFGVAPGMASPDNIWDFVILHPEKYTCIHLLERLGDG